MGGEARNCLLAACLPSLSAVNASERLYTLVGEVNAEATPPLRLFSLGRPPRASGEVIRDPGVWPTASVADGLRGEVTIKSAAALLAFSSSSFTSLGRLDCHGESRP